MLWLTMLLNKLLLLLCIMRLRRHTLVLMLLRAMRMHNHALLLMLHRGGATRRRLQGDSRVGADTRARLRARSKSDMLLLLHMVLLLRCMLVDVMMQMVGASWGRKRAGTRCGRGHLHPKPGPDSARDGCLRIHRRRSSNVAAPSTRSPTCMGVASKPLDLRLRLRLRRDGVRREHPAGRESSSTRIACGGSVLRLGEMHARHGGK